MKLHFDEKEDAMYLRLRDAKIIESEEVQPGIVLDFDEQGEVVAIEILGLKRRAPDFDPGDLKVDVA
jgi:uncharacterized protein YuzE